MVAGFLFGAANQQQVELDLLYTQYQLRLVDVAVLFLLLGLLTGFVLTMVFRIRRRLKKRNQQPSSTS
ncbi:lipopolysaccharide assembly protein LapA domain-containing protein [Alkalimonas sp.]|uniref:lipopolysaccharide assembly protein LapA domain-containing protein n=1 Tax=Alkalimonas sp. TaxID=1872453 RepID=UPI003454A797